MGRFLFDPFYNQIDPNELGKEKSKLLSECEGKYTRVKTFAKKEKSGRTYIRVDMRAANYTMLQKVLGLPFSWDAFFKHVSPSLKINDQTFLIPDLFYNSK